MPESIDPSRLTREELLLLQRRVLREWLDSRWLAEHSPRAWTTLSEREPTDVILDLDGGVGESAQYPGAIVVGLAPNGPPTRDTGEVRNIDVRWPLERGIPADANAVDQVIWTYDEEKSTELRANTFAEIQRVLSPSGLIVVRARDTDADRIERLLADGGYTLESSRGAGPNRIHQREYHFRATATTRPLSEVSHANRYERVLGELKPETVRQPVSR